MIIPEGVKKIDAQAFSNCKIEKLSLPKTLTLIGRDTFRDNNLTSIEIPNAVITIDYKTFYNNPLTSVTIKNTSDKVSLGTECFGTFDVNQINWEPVVE